MNTVRYLLLTLTLFGAFSASPIKAIPVTFTRVVLEKEGKIWKTIDLVGDYHHNVPVLSTDKNDPNETYLSEDEKKHCSDSERAFLNTLYYLDKNSPEKIDLLWEDGPQNEPQDGQNIMYIANPTHSLLGNKNLKNIYQKFTNKLSFIPADCWRNNEMRTLLLIAIGKIDLDTAQAGTYVDYFTFLHHIEDHFNGKAEAVQLLSLVKKHQSEEIYNQVKSAYDSFKDQQLKPLFDEYIKPYRDNNLFKSLSEN